VRGNIQDDRQVFAKTSQLDSLLTGTFTINGKTIALDVDQDTVQTLVGKINAADAGVTAAYNAAADKIEIETIAASEDLILVGADTTGFLAATNLSSDETVRGNISDNDQLLYKTTQFADVTDGSFRINGVTIAVDRNTDTLQSVLDRINSSGAGVTAEYDIPSDKLSILPEISGTILAIDNDTTGFLEATHMELGTVGLQVAPDAAFNATGLGAPRFDPDMHVVAGSFTINGVTIDVEEDDTVNTVLSRITASAAGVDAVFDTSTQKVRLTSRLGVAESVVLGSDTSGFLAAVKLDETAETTQATGSSSALASPLDDMSEYSNVTTGTVTANGVAIEIDPASTTIDSFLAALADIDGISAFLDETTGALEIRPERQGFTVTLSDTSGLLGTLGIQDAVYRSSARIEKVFKTQIGTERVSNASAVADQVAASTEKLNEAIDDFLKLRSDVPGARAETLAAIQRSLDAVGHIGGSLMLSRDASGSRLSLDRKKFAARLEENNHGETPDAEFESLIDSFLGQMTDLVKAESPKTDPHQLVLEQLREILRAQGAHPAVTSDSRNKSTVLAALPDFEAFNRAARENARHTRNWRA
jgi:hypothetical protein